MSDNLEKEIDELLSLIISIDNIETAKAFFNDLCTYKEINSMAGRLQAAKLLMAGKTYEEIIKQTDISSATLSRVSKCVKYSNGYTSVIKEK